MKASVHPRTLRNGTITYRVRWRQDGKQKTQSFVNLAGAERFRVNIEKFGPDEALRVIGIEDNTDHHLTLADAINRHIAALSGVEDGTIVTYRRFRDKDLADLGLLPLPAITETTVTAWLRTLHTAGNSGKTISNKHGFLSAVLGRAARDGLIDKNPCDRTRLPRKDAGRERTFLSRDEFEAIYRHIPDEWKLFARWLVATGMRFGEATALSVGDIDAHAGTCRISKAWKYTGTAETHLSHTKSRAGQRLINVPRSVIAGLDLNRPLGELLFLDPGRGGRITYPRFRHAGWRKAAAKAGIRAAPHDLRHTCASWMLREGIPIHVVQRHLGHENITTTVGVYGHTDRTSFEAAADAIGRMLD